MLTCNQGQPPACPINLPLSLTTASADAGLSTADFIRPDKTDASGHRAEEIHPHFSNGKAFQLRSKRWPVNNAVARRLTRLLQEGRQSGITNSASPVGLPPPVLIRLQVGAGHRGPTIAQDSNPTRGAADGSPHFLPGAARGQKHRVAARQL